MSALATVCKLNIDPFTRTIIDKARVFLCFKLITVAYSFIYLNFSFSKTDQFACFQS